MVYETFLESIRSSVQEKLGKDYQVSLQQILKNNGSVLDGLTIACGGSPLSPMIYLSSYYDEAEHGLPLPLIADQIVLLYEEQSISTLKLCEDLKDFSCIQNRIVYTLINAQNNTVLLSQIPHFDFLDLAVVFYLIVSECEDGQLLTVIRNEHLKLWNITQEPLLTLAEQNTPRLLPARISTIEDILTESGIRKEICETPLDQPMISLHVLTNKNGVNGAVALLYHDILKNFADSAQDDLIILPSSIHEVLLTPAADAFSYEELNEMVSLINRSEVPDEDRLSDHIYLYSREQDRITIPSICAEPCEIWNPQ